MSKTLEKLRGTRAEWIAHIDDERADGGSIIVTLRDGWHFDDERDCGVRGFDSVREVEVSTRRSDVYRPEPEPAEGAKIVELVPTWEGVIPLLVEAAANGTTTEARKTAMDELRRLARIVDERNAEIRAQKAAA